MRLQLKPFACLTALFALSVVLDAQKVKPPSGGGGNTLYPVTAEFRCPLTLECLPPEGIQGDSLGIYRGTTENGSATTPEGTASNNGSYMTEGNLFLFVLKPGLGRFVSFDFSRQTAAAPCAARGTCRKNFTTAMTDESLPGGRTYPVDAAGSDLPNGFMSVPVGGSARARFYINFADPSGRSLRWTVRFDPALYPGSTFLTVTRSAENVWTVEASPDAVAQLVSETISTGKTVRTNEGYYNVPFRITITR